MPQLRNFLPGAEPGREENHAPDTSYEDLLGKPATIGGKPSGYYLIRSMAAALNRSPGTIREWERTGVIPQGYAINEGSRNGRRRLYTRTQILKLRQLAAECDVLDNPRAIVKNSEFSHLAHLLFDQLRKEAA